MIERQLRGPLSIKGIFQDFNAQNGVYTEGSLFFVKY
jgi:hypothetical protein